MIIWRGKIYILCTPEVNWPNQDSAIALSWLILGQLTSAVHNSLIGNKRPFKLIQEWFDGIFLEDLSLSLIKAQLIKLYFVPLFDSCHGSVILDVTNWFDENERTIAQAFIL